MAINLMRAGVAGFALVAASVTFNALFLQREHLPKRQTAMSGKSTPASDTATVAHANRQGPAVVGPEGWLRLAEMRPNSASIRIGDNLGVRDRVASATISAIQRELRLRGYRPGSISGSADISTRAAILAFEHDHGLPLTAEPSAQLLKAVVMGAVPPSTTSVRRDATRQGNSPRVAEIVRFVQLRLNAENYQPGPVDGVMGSATVRAIREYELDQRMKPTGRISGALVERLRKGNTLALGQ